MGTNSNTEGAYLANTSPAAWASCVGAVSFDSGSCSMSVEEEPSVVWGTPPKESDGARTPYVSDGRRLDDELDHRDEGENRSQERLGLPGLDLTVQRGYLTATKIALHWILGALTQCELTPV